MVDLLFLGNEKPLREPAGKSQGQSARVHCGGKLIKKTHNAKVTISQFQKGVKLDKRKPLEAFPQTPQGPFERSTLRGNKKTHNAK